MLDSTKDHVIKAVHVVTTGSGEQHKEHRYGTWLPQLWWVLISQSWIKIPINCFAIEHRDGLVLFDTGMDPAIKTDPKYIDSALGRFLLGRIFKLHIGPDDALGRQLEQRGLSPSSVKKAVISHLHFDHIGGISDIPQADLLVNRDEWNILSTPHPEREWVLREHIELPDAKWQPLDFEATDDPLLASFESCYDVMGDGSLILLPTPGHTTGSQSMLVRSAGMSPLLLVGDLAYETELLFRDQVPGTGDAAKLKASYAKVRALKEQLPDIVILSAHDPGASKALT